MYSVNRFTHDQHGSVIHIERTVNGSELTPFQAVQRACKERRLWLEGGAKKVRILVDEMVMSPKQAEHWAREEYASLPKCDGCARVLVEGDIHQHRLSLKRFCSSECSDKDYNEWLDKQKDEEEIEYL